MTVCNALTPPKSTHPFNVAIALSLCALAPTSIASEQQAHQHGHAQLQMAVENNSIDLILTNPAHNLLGFEHQPHTQQQKQTLENARQWLTTQALITPDGGTCTVKSASMDFNAKATEQNHHDHGHDHDHDHDEANHQSDHQAENQAENEHANIEVSQVLDCTGTDLNNGFTTPLIGQFPEIQELNVEWVTNSGQGSVELSPPNNQFRL